MVFTMIGIRTPHTAIPWVETSGAVNPPDSLSLSLANVLRGKRKLPYIATGVL